MRRLVMCCVIAACAMIGRPVAGMAAPPEVACSLLTTAQVTAALNTAVGTGKPMTKKVCRWSQQGKGDDLVTLDLSLTTLDRYSKFKTAGNATVVSVAQLGDDAYYSTQSGKDRQVALCLKKGETAVIIHVFGGTKPTAEYESMEKAIADAVLPAL